MRNHYMLILSIRGGEREKLASLPLLRSRGAAISPNMGCFENNNRLLYLRSKRFNGGKAPGVTLRLLRLPPPNSAGFRKLLSIPKWALTSPDIRG